MRRSTFIGKNHSVRQHVGNAAYTFLIVGGHGWRCSYRYGAQPDAAPEQINKIAITGELEDHVLTWAHSPGSEFPCDSRALVVKIRVAEETFLAAHNKGYTFVFFVFQIL